MARKKSIATLVAIVDAFAKEPTWPQAELARRVGVTAETLRTTLEAMADEGWPFEREDEPPQVFWSLPLGFFAGGVLLPLDDAVEAVRQLGRLPPSEGRDKLIDRLLRCAPPSTRSLPATVHHVYAMDRDDELALQGIQDAIAHQRAIEVRYYSASRGSFEWRAVSFQRITQTSPIRLCGVCHRADELRWFRLDNVTAHRVCEDPYRAAPVDQLEHFLQTSVGGFHDGEAPEVLSFFVRMPESRWVKGNLPPPLTAREVDGGIWVKGEVAGTRRVAQFVVGLGGAARQLTPKLAAIVEELARGALSAATTEDPPPQD